MSSGPKVFLRLPRPSAHKLKAERLGKLLHELRRKVRATAILMRDQFALRFGFSIRVKVERKHCADVKEGNNVLVH